MEPNKLTTATKEELSETYAEIQAAKLPPRPCRYCGINFKPTNKWQNFCSPKHRTAFHNQADEKRIEYLEAELAHRTREMDDLRRELFAAERRIKDLEQRLE